MLGHFLWVWPRATHLTWVCTFREKEKNKSICLAQLWGPAMSVNSLVQSATDVFWFYTSSGFYSSPLNLSLCYSSFIYAKMCVPSPFSIAKIWRCLIKEAISHLLWIIQVVDIIKLCEQLVWVRKHQQQWTITGERRVISLKILQIWFWFAIRHQHNRMKTISAFPPPPLEQCSLK